jgi:arginyl-tRNA synthetase
MYLIEELNKNIKDIIVSLGLDDEVSVVKSSRPELGDYQYNGAMKLAGMNHMNPRELAQRIVDELSKNDKYTIFLFIINHLLKSIIIN